MRINYKMRGYGRTRDVEDFVEDVITERATSYYEGERPQDAIRELKRAFGRLVATLADREDLSFAEVISIVDPHELFEPKQGLGDR